MHLEGFAPCACLPSPHNSMLGGAGSTLVISTRPGESKRTGNLAGGEGEACKNESRTPCGALPDGWGWPGGIVRETMGRPGMDFPECFAYAIIAIAHAAPGFCA
jgi:hypothetical protein